MQPVEHPLDPEELNEYLDRELTSERAVVVAHHLAACAACRQVYEDLAGVSRDLSAWTIEAAPETLQVPRLPRKESVERKGTVQKGWRPRWLQSWALYPAVGVAAVVVLAVATFNTRPRTTSQVGRTVAAPQAAALAQGDKPETAEPAVQVQLGRTAQGQALTPAPRVIRTATLRLLAKDFDASRAAIDRIVAGAGGYLGVVQVSGVRPQARALRATVRVPSARLDAVIAALKALGEVSEESQAADDVSEQIVDLEARLANSRNTEQRMNELLRTRTGKLSEVLEAEREVSRVREEIERLDAQRKNFESRVSFSAISLVVNEEHSSSLDLGPLTLTKRLRNAFVDGFRTASESAVGAVLLALQVAPVLLFWGLVIGVPLWRVRRRRGHASA
jgi:predicted anti-sigma-YlaC factor YlaD